MTIGQKIKRIRVKRGLTQSELGEKVSLTGDRIRQYENDVRCPKPEMLQKIADALNVNIRAISDPSFNDAASAIYALFELEDTFNFHLEKTGDTFYLSFKQDYDNLESSALKIALENWYSVKNKLSPSLNEDIEDIQKKVLNYENWKWNYPKMSSDSSWERLQRIEQYKKQIELLENEEANNNSGEP